MSVVFELRRRSSRGRSIPTANKTRLFETTCAAGHPSLDKSGRERAGKAAQRVLWAMKHTEKLIHGGSRSRAVLRVLKSSTFATYPSGDPDQRGPSPEAVAMGKSIGVSRMSACLNKLADLIDSQLVPFVSSGAQYNSSAISPLGEWLGVAAPPGRINAGAPVSIF